MGANRGKFLCPMLVLTTVAFTQAQLVRVPNTTLQLPENLPAATSFTTENALGTMTFSFPMIVTSVPGDGSRLFVAQRTGEIRVVTDLGSTPVLQELPYLSLSNPEILEAGEALSNNPTTENGFLSMVFHPNFLNNRTLFVYFTMTKGGQSFQRLHRIVLDSATDNVASVASSQKMLTILDRASNHNGGDLHFGADGYLYLSLGDEGGGGDTYNNSRFITQRYTGNATSDRTGFWGQLLRIDVDERPGSLTPHAHQQNSASFPSAVEPGAYRIPADNPFIGRTSWHGVAIEPQAVRTEIWATGLRNPFRWSFDPQDGRLFLGDVGQGAYEEINLIARGDDMGWSWREGKHAYSNPPAPTSPPATGFDPVDPIFEYDRTNNGDGSDAVLNGTSVTGGAVYRGNRLTELTGAYVFADYNSGAIVALRENAGTWTGSRLATDNNISDFGYDPRNGDLLFTDLQSGEVKRLARAGGALPQPPATLSAVGAFSDLANLTPHPGIVPYDVNVPFWSDRAEKRRWFSIRNTTDAVAFSRDGNWTLPKGMVWIKHFDIPTGVPAISRKLETRVLVKTTDGVYGLSYRWNAAGTEADLVPEEGMNDPVSVTVDGAAVSQTWRFPSRSECIACHTPAGGHALSFNTRQLSRENFYGAETIHQIAALKQAGYISNEVEAPYSLPAFAKADDASESLEWRVRSYFDVNCSQCHQPGGSASGNWDARATTETDAAAIIRGLLVNPAGDPANRFIVPGDAGHSVALKRLQGIPSRMPPIGANVQDQSAIDLLTAWITQDLPTRQSFAEWRVSQFGETLPAGSGEDDDPDGDGIRNRAEYLAGTNPKAGNPSPVRIEREGDVLKFSHSLPANRSLVIEASGNLAPGSWVPWDVPGNVPVFRADGGPQTLEFTMPQEPKWFFRGKISSP